jgi:hypothetical protein
MQLVLGTRLVRQVREMVFWFITTTDSGDAIIAMQTDISSGNAFTSYIQSDNDSAFSGWSVGVTGESSDFRITENYQKVSEPTATALFIEGTSATLV